MNIHEGKVNLLSRTWVKYHSLADLDQNAP